MVQSIGSGAGWAGERTFQLAGRLRGDGVHGKGGNVGASEWTDGSVSVCPACVQTMAGNAALVRARQALYGKFVGNVHQMGL